MWTSSRPLLEIGSGLVFMIISRTKLKHQEMQPTRSAVPTADHLIAPQCGVQCRQPSPVLPPLNLGGDQ